MNDSRKDSIVILLLSHLTPSFFHSLMSLIVMFCVVHCLWCFKVLRISHPLFQSTVNFLDLKIIHFENYGKLLERDLDVSVYIEEHIHLKHNLSKISHRFRIYLVLEWLFVTASQFVDLLETTGNLDIINFINGGDFAVNAESVFLHR